MMISNEWKLIEQADIGSWNTKIWLIDKTREKVRIAHIVKGQLESSEAKQDGSEEPTLTLPTDIWQSIKESMIDNKVRDKSEVEAELSATQYHLEDMRKLVFRTQNKANE